MSPPNFDEISKNNAKNTNIIELSPPNFDEISKNNIEFFNIFSY